MHMCHVGLPQDTDPAPTLEDKGIRNQEMRRVSLTSWRVFLA